MSAPNSPITAPWRQTVGGEYGSAQWVRALQLAFNKSTASTTLELWLWQLALADYTVRRRSKSSRARACLLTPPALPVPPPQVEKLITPSNPRAMGAAVMEERRFGVVEETEVGVRRWEAKLRAKLLGTDLPAIPLTPASESESQAAAAEAREAVTIVVLDWKDDAEDAN